MGYKIYYQTISFIIFETLKFKVETEITTSQSRIDTVVEVHRFIYLFEFKLVGTKEETLQQITTKQYYQKYLYHNKAVIMVGTACDQVRRSIKE